MISSARAAIGGLVPRWRIFRATVAHRSTCSKSAGTSPSLAIEKDTCESSRVATADRCVDSTATGSPSRRRPPATVNSWRQPGRSQRSAHRARGSEVRRVNERASEVRENLGDGRNGFPRRTLEDSPRDQGHGGIRAHRLAPHLTRAGAGRRWAERSIRHHQSVLVSTSASAEARVRVHVWAWRFPSISR